MASKHSSTPWIATLKICGKTLRVPCCLEDSTDVSNKDSYTCFQDITMQSVVQRYCLERIGHCMSKQYHKFKEANHLVAWMNFLFIVRGRRTKSTTLYPLQSGQCPRETTRIELKKMAEQIGRASCRERVYVLV